MSFLCRAVSNPRLIVGNLLVGMRTTAESTNGFVVAALVAQEQMELRSTISGDWGTTQGDPFVWEHMFP